MCHRYEQDSTWTRCGLRRAKARRWWLRLRYHSDIHNSLDRAGSFRDLSVAEVPAMAEVTLDLRSWPKADAYLELADHIEAVLGGIDDEIAEMATISSLVHNAFGFLWTGFYRVIIAGSFLRVGPYQGTLGCLEIAFGRGVCGTAAAEKRTIIVRNVNDFPGHIACDATAMSEIVLPVVNSRGELLGVFDIDSERINTFDDADAIGLTRIVDRFARPRTPELPE